MRSYSMRDIARLAGVSVGTVSRIVNQTGGVSEEVRQRTMEIIRNVNYRVGPRGRQPEKETPARIGRRTKRIAVLYPVRDTAWDRHEIWVSFMRGIETACQERNGEIRLLSADGYDRPGAVRETVLAADGVLIYTDVLYNPGIRSHAVELLPHLPVVGFGAPQGDFPLPYVASDNVASGMLVTRELLRCGHRRIAFVNSHADRDVFIARLCGYMQAMREAGRFRADHVLEESTPVPDLELPPQKTPPDLLSLLDRLLALPERPTAAVVANDWAACGLINACRLHGVRVPEDLSVTGMDDSSVCQLVHPALSSVDFALERISLLATNLLCDFIDGVGVHQRNTPLQILLPGIWRPRGSIAPPPPGR